MADTGLQSPLHSPKSRSGSLDEIFLESRQKSAIKGVGGVDPDESGEVYAVDEAPYLEQRAHHKQHIIHLLEVDDVGNSNYRYISLRDLLEHVHDITDALDADLIASWARRSPETNMTSDTNDDAPDDPKLSPTAAMLQSSAASVLKQRDLRRLEYLFTSEEPTILIRRHAVIMSFDAVRAIVLHDRLLMIVPQGADSLIELLQKHLEEFGPRRATNPSSMNLAAIASKKLGEPHAINKELRSITDNTGSLADISFATRCYESILATVVSVQSQELNQCTHLGVAVHQQIKTATMVSIDLQEQMRVLKDRLAALLHQIKGDKRALEDIVVDDEELAMMDLGKLKQMPKLYESPLKPAILASHEDMEAMLESYLVDFNTLQTKLEYIRSQIQSAEELVNLRLNTSRNQLLVVDTIVSICTMGFALGSFVFGMFGMNLTSGKEDADNWFTPVAVGFTICSMMLISLPIIYLVYHGIIPYGSAVMPSWGTHHKSRSASHASLSSRLSGRASRASDMGRPSERTRAWSNFFRGAKKARHSNTMNLLAEGGREGAPHISEVKLFRSPD